MSTALSRCSAPPNRLSWLGCQPGVTRIPTYLVSTHRNGTAISIPTSRNAWVCGLPQAVWWLAPTTTMPASSSLDVCRGQQKQLEENDDDRQPRPLDAQPVAGTCGARNCRGGHGGCGHSRRRRTAHWCQSADHTSELS